MKRFLAHSERLALRLDDLMQASEQRLGAAARSETAHEQLIAARITNSPRDFGLWEAYHAGLMKQIVSAGDLEAQKSQLLSASLGLIHRKALFEYLQHRQLRGRPRVQLLQHFSANTDYYTSVIQEHGRYLRSAASYMCSSHVGLSLLLDDTFDAPLLRYERMYTDYFRAHCDFQLGSSADTERDLRVIVLKSLKREVSEWRHALFAFTQSRSGVWRTPAELKRLRDAAIKEEFKRPADSSS